MRAEPFKPLQVRLTDGTTYVITHPKLSMVTRERLIVGFPEPSSNGQLAGGVVNLDWSQIDAINPLVPEKTVA